ncbi:MAG: acyl-CoA dehydrogenase [Gammaproteobacteria bacterium]|jgi:acyl-CoA dehydrogenase|nr:acyl-CoA dehydrogenase [Gammaproteobacteria bacterium]
MNTLLWLIFWLGGLITLAYMRTSIIIATGVIGAGLLATTVFSNLSWFSLLLLWVIYGAAALVLNHVDYRRRYLIIPAFDGMKKSIPTMSETEKVALDAGTVGWDGELFSGTPQWEKLLTRTAPKLSEEEKAFVEGPVKHLCEIVNDWEVTHEQYDLPANAWQYIKDQGFFALIIPKKYGGKGFSAFAHSEILATLAGRSLTLASTVAVPNSLGPAELLLHYGTPEQRDYYLPRLARGEEIPCFALTGPNAGSDAGSIPDTGIICKGQFEGKEIIGIKLNWNKRYITLAPIATLLGLAFKLYDPERLIGDNTDLGITCALIPTKLPGITIGRRHLPVSIPFQNGPTQGKDVFIPLDYIIGGTAMAGHGWRMLVECLSTGRAISLPSSSAGGARVAALTAGAYSRIRRQFRTSISSFEGVQEVLGRIGAFTYISEAVRCFTVAMIDAGEKPSVPGAISKYHVTELGRKIANDVMDIHGGKGIMMGPKNYLASAYQGVPIGITVEGANILTRSMIIFGQGAIRCHPYILKEMQALQHENLNDFEHFLGEHISYTLSNAARAFVHGLTLAKFAKSPINNATKPYFQQLTRASSAFALVADASMALLGGKLKFKESISARLGDLLAQMYIMSAVLKRYQDQGAPESDLSLLRWSLDYSLANFWRTMDELLSNLGNRWVAYGLRIIVMPLGLPRHTPLDALNKEITAILTTPCDARKRLCGNFFVSTNENDCINTLEKALEETVRLSPLLKRVYDAIKSSELAQGPLKQCIDAALHAKIINEKEAVDLYYLDTLIQEVIAVDDFSLDELKGTESVGMTTRPQKHHAFEENSSNKRLN